LEIKNRKEEKRGIRKRRGVGGGGGEGEKFVLNVDCRPHLV
jgi:hypothetical protein